jgi:pteridine reductase
MAKELAPGICVNAVAPGVITWPTEAEKAEYDRQVKMIPAGRVGTPEEIAAAVLFLLSNDYITGQVLNVDGGRCI